MSLSVVEIASGVWQARAAHVSWVLVTDGDGVTMVDTGYPGDRDRVVASLEAIGRSPADVDAVVLTHAHPDHIGNAEEMRSRTGTTVWVHEREAAHASGQHIEQVSVPTLLSMAWRPSVMVWVLHIGIGLRAHRVHRVQTTQTFTEQPLDVPGGLVPVPTPGHTSGHTAVHLPGRGVLLVGDALMTDHALASAPGPRLLPDVFSTDPDQARRSLGRLRGLAADVVVPGHGPAFVGTPDEAVDLALAV